MNELPLYSTDLIRMLKDKYPEKCPEINETEREIFYYKGKCDLIKELVTLEKITEDDFDFNIIN